MQNAQKAQKFKTLVLMPTSGQDELEKDALMLSLKEYLEKESATKNLKKKSLRVQNYPDIPATFTGKIIQAMISEDQRPAINMEYYFINDKFDIQFLTEQTFTQISYYNIGDTIFIGRKNDAKYPKHDDQESLINQLGMLRNSNTQQIAYLLYERMQYAKEYVCGAEKEPNSTLLNTLEPLQGKGLHESNDGKITSHVKKLQQKANVLNALIKEEEKLQQKGANNPGKQKDKKDNHLIQAEEASSKYVKQPDKIIGPASYIVPGLFAAVGLIIGAFLLPSLPFIGGCIIFAAIVVPGLYINSIKKDSQNHQHLS
jgi:hypothetical protein